MTLERSIDATATEKKADIPQVKKAGEFIMKHEDIPAEIQTYVQERLGRDSDGNQRRDETGAEFKPSIVPAKENGNYKGTIILNADNYIVQTVGKEARTAVVHRKEDVALMGSRLQWRDENKKLHNADVQIYYNGNKAKAYPWDREKALEAARTPGKTAMNAETVIEKARQYAAESIKGAKQREAFLAHLENFGRQLSGREPPGQTAAKPERKAEQGIER
ncbi:MAG: hypothetical protein LBS70_05430 [Candidatus Accumulibacter sp.]|jgi:hypothetical protein|nr:hypothetical protein [Accumulibacter sp.]